MKKILLALVLVLMLAVPAFAQIIGPVENGNGSMNNVTNQQVQATGGTGIGYGGNASVYAPDYSYKPQMNYNNVYSPSSAGASNWNYSPSSSSSGASIYAPDYSYNPDYNNQSNVGIVSPEITNEVNVENTNVNVNVNDPTFNNRNVIERGAIKNTNKQDQKQQQGQMQGQKQGQDQGQQQGQNNEQTIAPTQTVTIKTEKPFVNIPSVGTPELNFGNGRMLDASKMLPKFKGVTLLKDGDVIHTVVDMVANVPFKKLYKTILRLSNENVVQAPYMRFQIIRAEGQKSWTSGGSLSGGGTGVVGATGMAGGGSLIPSIGGTKAHDLFTILVVNVIPE